MSKFGANLPAVLIPDGEICVYVTIPNHPDYVKLFLRAVRMLEVQRMYARDETMQGAKIVVEQWRDRTINPLIEALATGLGCPEENPECLEYPPYAGFIKYFPDNPYTDDEGIPPGYLMPAWWRWGTLDTALPDFIDDFINHQIEQFTGYRNNDAICWISSLLSLNIPAWFGSGYAYPSIEIELSGSGEATIALLSFPLGSRCLIALDEKPDLGDILSGGFAWSDAFVIDTARDLLSYPPEEYPEIRFKMEIEEDGDHTIYLMFLPVFNFEISEEVINFGGGFRGIELCGNLRPRNQPEQPPPPPLEGVTELRPEFQFTADCGMEYRLRDQEDNIVQDWTPVAGWVDNAALCFGGNMPTIEEICEAVQCAAKEIASDYLRGALSTAQDEILLNADGTVTVTPTGTITNDPTTSADEEARAGGAQAVSNGINNLITDLWGHFGPNEAEDMPLADAQFLINARYLTDPTLMDAAISDYWVARAAAATTITSLTVSSLTQDLYCDGVSIKTAIDHVSRRGDPLSARKLTIALISALKQEQIDVWYNRGALVPSTDYLEFECTPFDSETIVFSQAAGDLAGSAYKTGSVVNKNNHRVRLTVSGKIVDTVAGGYQDFFWKVTSAGVKTLVGISGSDGTFQCNENWDEPTAAEVPFRDDGIYNVTRETFPTGCTFLSIRRKMTNPTAGGSFSMTITDLGEIIT